MCMLSMFAVRPCACRARQILQPLTAHTNTHESSRTCVEERGGGHARRRNVGRHVDPANDRHKMVSRLAAVLVCWCWIIRTMWQKRAKAQKSARSAERRPSGGRGSACANSLFISLLLNRGRPPSYTGAFLALFQPMVMRNDRTLVSGRPPAAHRSGGGCSRSDQFLKLVASRPVNPVSLISEYVFATDAAKPATHDAIHCRQGQGRCPELCVPQELCYDEVASNADLLPSSRRADAAAQGPHDRRAVS